MIGLRRRTGFVRSTAPPVGAIEIEPVQDAAVRPERLEEKVLAVEAHGEYPRGGRPSGFLPH